MKKFISGENYLTENHGNAAHPGLWAAMVVHGKTENVIKSSSKDYIPVLLIAVAIAVILLTTSQIMGMKKGNVPIINSINSIKKL